tara:strand:+ start:279 stop:509 length:231 start_codon:yes stop_codon:yes gene_type:complete
VADEFLELYIELARDINYGNPMDPASDMGTVISEYQAKLYLRGTHNNSLKMQVIFVQSLSRSLIENQNEKKGKIFI